MGINMSYCMFENTVTAMKEMKEKMWEEDFDPNTLSKYERRAYDELYDLIDSIQGAMEAVEEREEEADLARRLEAEEDDE